MKTSYTHFAVSVVLAVVVSGCAGTDSPATFTPATEAGAPDRVVGGVEFYLTTQPVRAYAVMGVITDTQDTRYADLARQIRDAGGDAAVLKDSETRVKAVYRTRHGLSLPIEETTRSFQVLKWK
jgi:hypothetical protein